jgi:predicted PurR-regulated permease PerM
MLGIDPKAARATWTAALTLLLLAGVYAIRYTLVVFAVALLFAYLLYPLVDRIGRRFSLKNRALGLALTYLLVMGILTGIGAAVGSQVAVEARQLIARPPDIRGFFERLQLSYPILAPAIETIQGGIRQQLGEILSEAPRFSLEVIAASANLIGLIVIPILSFFILKDGQRIRDAFLRMFTTDSARMEAERTLLEIHALLLQYMRSLLFLCCSVFVVFGLFFTMMRVPYALLLSTIAFFFEFVPLFGPMAAAVVILLVSAMSGYPHFWALMMFLVAFRVVQDYVISPKLMSRRVELHPLLVMFGVFAGGELGGVAGIFLSVPVLALARLVIHRVHQRANRSNI